MQVSSSCKKFRNMIFKKLKKLQHVHNFSAEGIVEDFLIAHSAASITKDCIQVRFSYFPKCVGA